MPGTFYADEQTDGNAETFTNFGNLSGNGSAPREKVDAAVIENPRVGCTGCRLCTDDCPLDLRIPDLVGLYNEYLVHKTAAGLKDRYDRLTRDTGKAGDCAGCRVCEGQCKNQVKIYDTIKKIADLLE